MTIQQKSILIYLAALVAVVVLLVLHFAARSEGTVSLRIHVERASTAVRQRTYRIELNDTRNDTPLNGATVLVFTQARGADSREILVVATPTDQSGVYIAQVPFSHDGDWFIHIGLNRPIATHVSFGEEIQGTTLGPPIPLLTAEGEPVGEVTWRTLADGYAFVTHLAATATLGIALTLLFVAIRGSHRLEGERTVLGAHLFWASMIVLVSTGIYNFVYHTISEAPVPLTLNLAEIWRQFALSNYGEVYAVVLATKHLAILALIGAGAAFTLAWRIARSGDVSERSRKISTVASAVAVILGAIILLLGGTLVYLHAISEH